LLSDFNPYHRYSGICPDTFALRCAKVVAMTRRTPVAALATVAAAVLVSGCEDSAAGFGEGIGRAIGLLLLLGLVLPAVVVGTIVLAITTVRRRRGPAARVPPPPPPPPGSAGWPG
jgi:hypothetical protein